LIENYFEIEKFETTTSIRKRFDQYFDFLGAEVWNSSQEKITTLKTHTDFEYIFYKFFIQCKLQTRHSIKVPHYKLILGVDISLGIYKLVLIEKTDVFFSETNLAT